MEGIKAKEELIKLLNQALQLEHAARIQYLAHAELVDGLNAEPIIERLKEIAGDEKKHEDIFRKLIGMLGGEPTMGMAETHRAKTIQEILEVNLKDEKHAVDVYTGILKRINELKDSLPYEHLTLEHDVRHVIMDEQEHISELKILLARTD
ncbi:MAG: ferritin-like domain-containing protein [Nitrososphaerales archaeon]